MLTIIVENRTSKYNWKVMNDPAGTSCSNDVETMLYQRREIRPNEKSILVSTTSISKLQLMFIVT